MSHFVAIDTLAYANKLKAAGLDPKLAEAQANAQAELLSVLIDDQLATKQDLKDVHHELTSEIQDVQNKLKSEIQEVHNEVMSEIQDVRSEVQDVRNEIKQLGNKLVIKCGGMAAASTGLLATLLTLFHIH